MLLKTFCLIKLHFSFVIRKIRKEKLKFVRKNSLTVINYRVYDIVYIFLNVVKFLNCGIDFVF